MKNSVGIRELRQQASSILKRVAAGDTVEITEYGHPIARIVPLRSGVLEQMIIEGSATSTEGDLIDLLDQMSLPAPALESVLPSQALQELRSER
jgi:prevent-host-death family protein